MPIPLPSPTPLFGGQLFYGQNFPIHAWKLWTSPTAMTRSWERPDNGASFAFLAANASIYALLVYHLYPNKDWIYGAPAGTVFVLPDGTSRPWASMNAAAYTQLLGRLAEEEEIWPPGLGAP